MQDELAYISWDFLSIHCGCEQHAGEDVHMSLSDDGRAYVCTDPSCKNKLPVDVYEKLLSKILKMINENKIVTNVTWRDIIKRQSFTITITGYKLDKKMSIKVKNNSLGVI